MSILTARRLTNKSAEDLGFEMSVTGTVTKVVRHKTEMGNLRLLVDVLTDDTGYGTRLRYIQVRQPIPVKGQHVTISGVLLNFEGKQKTNIGAVSVTIG